MGGNHVNFGTVGGPPYAHDLERGRRTGTLADFTELVKLAQALNIVHFHGRVRAGAPGRPGADPPYGDGPHPARLFRQDPVRLDQSRRRASRTSSSWCAWPAALSREQMLREPSYYSVINTNSPMQLDGADGHGRHRDSPSAIRRSCITPFTLLGAMAPVTIAGAIAQQNAEALAAIALSQIVRPGAPLIYGGFTSNVDMRTRRARLRHARIHQGRLIGGQMARRYGMPYRSSNTNASVWPDAQADL